MSRFNNFGDKILKIRVAMDKRPGKDIYDGMEDTALRAFGVFLTQISLFLAYQGKSKASPEVKAFHGKRKK